MAKLEQVLNGDFGQILKTIEQEKHVEVDKTDDKSEEKYLEVDKTDKGRISFPSRILSFSPDRLLGRRAVETHFDQECRRRTYPEDSIA